jgi:hypothetical protein
MYTFLSQTTLRELFFSTTSSTDPAFQLHLKHQPDPPTSSLIAALFLQSYAEAERIVKHSASLIMLYPKILFSCLTSMGNKCWCKASVFHDRRTNKVRSQAKLGPPISQHMMKTRWIFLSFGPWWRPFSFVLLDGLDYHRARLCSFQLIVAHESNPYSFLDYGPDILRLEKRTIASVL